MANSDFLPFPDLVAQISRLCGQGTTGTVLLVSDDNRMAQVHLHQGQIVFVMCRGRRGRDALDIMRTMRNARLSIDGLAAVNDSGAGLPTADILAFLGGALEKLPDGTAAAGSARSAAAAPADFLTPQMRTVFQQALTRYIGPMAEIVAGEHFDSAADVRALAIALAAEIPGREQGLKFKADIAKALALDGL
jgi:hypothetical protein